nr:unnamed protein product [Digitaria exilis]
MPLHLATCRLFLLLLLLAVVTTSSAVTTSSNSNRSSSSNCTLLDAEFVRAAFLHVANFTLPSPNRRTCRPVRRLRFPSRNLSGAVEWSELGNLSSLLTVDLSGNSLQGHVDASFWRAPLLRAVDVSRNNLNGTLQFDLDVDDDPSSNKRRLASLDVSRNQFTSMEGVAGLTGLQNLNVSRNRIGEAPDGLRNLTKMLSLDLSWNGMTGRFPDDLPPLSSLQFLNISYNNFSGVVDADIVGKFGSDAFIQAGNTLQFDPPPSSGSGHKIKRVVLIAVIAAGAVVTVVAFVAVCCCCCMTRGRRKKKGNKEGKAAVWEDEEVVVGAAKVDAAAPVVVLERPLMELTLADLAAATSGFGRESQLAAETGGRSGAAYRAVLPGDLHVVVRVVEGPVAGVREEDDDEAAMAAGLRELARLRHPNILPLLGYCIAGKQKLLLFEYMEKGDLHRWLHELPVGSMDTEDIGIDTVEAIEDRKPAGDWPTRYRIILGIARGLAFLHQGSIVHGRLVPTNILLDDDMEPRICDFLPRHVSGGGGETPEGDVYRFGTLVFELVTGQARWNDASTSWARGVIRNRKGLNLVDDRLRDDETAAVEKEMEDCLQVGFLCTASSPEKRPTMQQVVGLLKDVRPAAPPDAGEPPVAGHMMV